MILIAHRGNIKGRDERTENDPNRVYGLLQLGIHVEVDVWFKGPDGGLWLGHYGSQYLVFDDFFEHNNLWCHAKDVQTLYVLQRMGVHCFYIDTSSACTLTSKGYIWTSPNQQLTENSIAVMPEQTIGPRPNIAGVAGVCSDDLTEWL